MRKLLKTLLVGIAAIFLLGGTATAAPSLDFSGDLTFSDEDSDGFSETLTFNTFLDFFVSGEMSGYINDWDPDDDPLFSDGFFEYNLSPNLTLDPDSFVSGERYDFFPQNYTDGFQLIDNDGSILFKGDLELDSLYVNADTGLVNSDSMINLFNITPGETYLAGSSPIVDYFIDAEHAAWQITTQFENEDFAGIIESGASAEFSYSGAIAAGSGGGNGGNGGNGGTPAPIPEPSTVILLGTGLAGLILYRRRGYNR